MQDIKLNLLIEIKGEQEGHRIFNNHDEITTPRKDIKTTNNVFYERESELPNRGLFLSRFLCKQVTLYEKNEYNG